LSLPITELIGMPLRHTKKNMHLIHRKILLTRAPWYNRCHMFSV